MKPQEMLTAKMKDLTHEQQRLVFAFESAKEAMVEAFTNLRVACGEGRDQECSHCDGTGKTVTMETCCKPDAEKEYHTCYFCKGSGRRPHTFPWVVTGIDWTHFKGLTPTREGRNVTWVSIHPCGEQYGGKTYLGYLLGDIALMPGASLQQDGTLELYSGGNPAIFVPELGKVIFGAESWWGAIKSPDDLRKITKEDINNVWYVQALKDLSKTPEGA